MATEVILPRVDMDMAEGKVAHWYVKNGETVRQGQVLFEIETDKATMEVDSAADGVMHGIHGEIGVTIPVGRVIAWILAPGEAPPAPAATSTAGMSEEAGLEVAALAESPVTGRATAEASPAGETVTDSRLLRATPLARSLAREHGVDLTRVAGSGPDGRVIGRDVQAALAAVPSSGAPAAQHELHLQWARRGSGTPLLLIHGFGADQGSWRPLVQHVPNGRGVVAIDLPNHGKSAARLVETLHDAGRLILERINQEGIGACHLLGHSLGGGVALALTKAAPERVRSLTLLAPAGLGADINVTFIESLVQAHDEATLRAAMSALFHDPAGLTASFVATAFQQLRAPARRAALASMAKQLMPQGRPSQSLREVLDDLRIPAQIIWGTDDRIIPMHPALHMPAHVGVHLLPGVGHLPQVEAAALVAALLDHQMRGATESA